MISTPEVSCAWLWVFHFVIEQEMSLSNIPVTYMGHRRIVALQQSSAKKDAKSSTHIWIVSLIRDTSNALCIMMKQNWQTVIRFFLMLVACYITSPVEMVDQLLEAHDLWSFLDSTEALLLPRLIAVSHCGGGSHGWFCHHDRSRWVSQWHRVTWPKKRYQNGGSMMFNVVQGHLREFDHDAICVAAINVSGRDLTMRPWIGVKSRFFDRQRHHKERSSCLPDCLHASLVRMGGESPLSLVAGLILTMMAMKFSYADSLLAGAGWDSGWLKSF